MSLLKNMKWFLYFTGIGYSIFQGFRALLASHSVTGQVEVFFFKSNSGLKKREDHNCMFK